jgi:hypothetical protein
LDTPAHNSRSKALGAALIGASVALVAPPSPAAELPAPGVILRAAAIELATLPPLSFQLMTLELDALLAEAGVGLQWRRARPNGETSAEEIRVVFLDASGRGAHAERPVLAASGPAGPAPTIWVYTPTVHAALARPGPAAAAQPFPAQRDLGIALGRVLAHELVHLLAPEVPHGTGVMAPCFHLTELGSGRMAYDSGCVRALATAADAWHRRGGPPPEEERRVHGALAAKSAAEDAKGR